MKVRKVMQLGRSSLVVSLPKGWADQYELTKGDELVFETRGDGSLGIYPRDTKRDKASKITITVPPTADKGMVERQLIAAYLSNFPEIEICSTDDFTSDQQEELRARLKELVGLQIIETSSKMVRIQSIVNVSDLNLEKSLNRAHSITASMLEDAIRALETSDIDLAKSIVRMDDDVNQFYFLILKQLQFALQNPITMKELGIDLVDVLSYHSVLRRIEHVADHAKMIAESVAVLHKHKAPIELIQLVTSYLKQVYDIYCQAVEGLSFRKINMVNEAINNRYRIRRELTRDLLREIGRNSKTRIEEAKNTIGDPDKGVKGLKKLAESYEVYCLLRTLADKVERVADYAADIAEVAINRTLKSPPSEDV